MYNFNVPSLSLVQILGHLVVEWRLHELAVVSPSLSQVWQSNEALPVGLQGWELGVKESVSQLVEHVYQLGEVEV